ncbi:transmembrane protein 119 [Trichomycterus rosablanca]|uniref:transmembrane protein 119 n=1 Tax=Trichomycterus rosablanca TaxID=2290929 RepID=UPI002F34F083
MSSSVSPHLSILLFLALWTTSVLTFPINTITEGSGDEPELIFPTPRSTRAPPRSPPRSPPSPPSPSSSPSSTPLPEITLTFIRIKDFLFNQVVDFLRDNMLLILVIMSLLIVMIFIACCASAMSHKRKLEAYYPPKKQLPRKVTAAGTEQAQAKPEPQSAAAATSYHRAPTKALVGEKDGKDPRPKPREVQRAEDVEEVEVQKEEKKEPKPSTSTAGGDQAPVCTCHLKKAKQASH